MPQTLIALIWSQAEPAHSEALLAGEEECSPGASHPCSDPQANPHCPVLAKIPDHAGLALASSTAAVLSWPLQT